MITHIVDHIESLVKTRQSQITNLKNLPKILFFFKF